MKEGLGYKEACCSFICSLSIHRAPFLSVFALSYPPLLFDYIPIVLYFDKFFVRLFYVCYTQSTRINPYLNSESAVPEPRC